MSRAVGRASFGVALAVLGLVACGPAPTGIAYVHERYRSEADVARASEAFHAKEHHGDDVVSGPRRSPGKVIISMSSSTGCRRPMVA